MDNKFDFKRYCSRKFLMAVAIQIVGTVALFQGLFDASNYVALSALNLGAYGAANVMGKKNGK